MTIPGTKEAAYVQAKIEELGIQDVKLFYDAQILPRGMWVVCQVNKVSGRILLPDNYVQEDIKPYIMWYVKSTDGRFRFPSDRDISDIIATRQRAEKIWDKGGDFLADKLDEQSKEKDEKHNQAFKQKIKDISPAMKKAIKKENW